MCPTVFFVWLDPLKFEILITSDILKKSPTVQEEDCGATGFYGFCFLEGNMKNHAL